MIHRGSYSYIPQMMSRYVDLYRKIIILFYIKYIYLQLCLICYIFPNRRLLCRASSGPTPNLWPTGSIPPMRRLFALFMVHPSFRMEMGTVKWVDRVAFSRMGVTTMGMDTPAAAVAAVWQIPMDTVNSQGRVLSALMAPRATRIPHMSQPCPRSRSAPTWLSRRRWMNLRTMAMARIWSMDSLMDPERSAPDSHGRRCTLTGQKIIWFTINTMLTVEIAMICPGKYGIC